MGTKYSKYKKNDRIHWTEETDKAYAQIIKLVDECPTLFYIDDTSPIHLYTDASDYGIGAFLFQIVDGKVRPIEFLSKSLNKQQIAWDVPDSISLHIIN